MATEAGHHASRSYTDQNGAFHLNGAAFYNDAEEDISQELEALDGVADALAAFDTLTATEIGYLDGTVPGTVVANKAVVPSTGKIVDELDITLLKIGSVTKTNVVIGAAAGYKIARSASPVSLDGSNPTSVAHGLTACVAVCVQLVGSAAPGDSTSVLTAVINGANIDVYAWKHTTGGAAGNPTLVASTGTETFNWFAIGT